MVNKGKIKEDSDGKLFEKYDPKVSEERRKRDILGQRRESVESILSGGISRG